MNEISKILLTQRNSAIDEVYRSSPNLNTKSECKDIDINVPKIGGDETSQSISKSQQVISMPFTDPETNGYHGNVTAIMSVNQPEQPCNEASLSASFRQLSRRESSLENLAEDDTNIQINVSASDNTVTYFQQKPNTSIDIKDFTKKSESSSRFRRTIHSLFSCCSTKSRRPILVAKTDTSLDGNNESETENCTSQIISDRPRDKDHTTSFNCLRLRKLFDILDESEPDVKRGSHIRQSFPTVPFRDGDRTDVPGNKISDNLQSENGGSNLPRSMLLGPMKPADQGKKCFIIDLDETLVHSSFKMVDKADFKVGVDIEGTVHTVYVLKRPHVDIFLQKMGRIFECVLFTASLAKYADPVTDFLDKWRVFRWRLFRESCVFHRGNYVKDLGMLGRPTDQIAILDNSPASYMFHPDNAVQITSWFDDAKDTALLDLIPYLEQLSQAPSVPSFLAAVKPPARATVPVSVMLPSPAAGSTTGPGMAAPLQPYKAPTAGPITSVEQPPPSVAAPVPPPPPASPLIEIVSPQNLLAKIRSLPSHNGPVHWSSLPSVLLVDQSRDHHCIMVDHHDRHGGRLATSHSEGALPLVLALALPEPGLSRRATGTTTMTTVNSLVIAERPRSSRPRRKRCQGRSASSCSSRDSPYCTDSPRTRSLDDRGPRRPMAVVMAGQ